MTRYLLIITFYRPFFKPTTRRRTLLTQIETVSNGLLLAKGDDLRYMRMHKILISRKGKCTVKGGQGSGNIVHQQYTKGKHLCQWLLPSLFCLCPWFGVSCSFIPTLVISFNDDLWSLLRLNFAAFPPEDSAPEPFSTQGTDCVMWPAVLKESIKPEKAHT